MKKALQLIIVYFELLILGIIIGTFIYTMYLGICSYVLGTKFHAFTMQNLITSFFHVSFAMFILICPLITYYRIRHPGGAFQVFVYIFLSLLTWLVFFPAFVFWENRIDDKHIITENFEMLSEGYFRKSGTDVYYFTKEFDNKIDDFNSVTSGILIDTSEDGVVDFKEFYNSPDFSLYQNALPFREVEMKSASMTSNSPLPFKLSFIIESGKEACNKSIFDYIGFLSFGLIICSLYVSVNFFGWKLMNSALLMFLTTLTVSFNSLYFSSFFAEFFATVNTYPPFKLMSGFTEVPFLVVLNTFFGLVFIITGIIMAAVNNHKKI